MIRSVDMSSAHVRLPFELLDARVVQNQNSKLNISLNLANFLKSYVKLTLMWRFLYSLTIGRSQLKHLRWVCDGVIQVDERQHNLV